MHHPVLKHAEIVQFHQHHTADFEYNLFFVEKFLPLKKKEGSMDMLFEHFTDHQTLQDGLYMVLSVLTKCGTT